jgi:hypothetical protein
MALPLKELISICEENRELIGEQSYKFIDDMVARRNRFGDSLYASPRQLKYLRILVGRFCPVESQSEEKPKSKIEQLREKRDALLRASKRRATAEKVREQQQYLVMGKLRNGELQVSDTPTARIRHQRSVKAEHANNPSPIKTSLQ